MLSKSQMSKIQSLFIEASDEQMQEIAQMFNDTRRIKAAQAARSFKVGQQVTWFGKKGQLSGVVAKINRKNVVVNAGQNGMWNVTASMLIAR